ncbi:MAG TPA: hypothetical protein VL727_26155 [Puia sp.]|nr:hypothetical protein [Puia sp.]
MELPPAGRRGSFLLVGLLLLIAILLEQYWLVRLLPWLSDLGGVQPSIIFLDIPLRLPVIDWIPVGALFLFFYLVVVSPELSRQRQYWQQHAVLHSSPSPASLGQKGWSVFTGWWLMLICLLSGGGLYYLLEDQLPKQVRNGIDSFGIRADISVPWPGENIIHLHGGMIMLITFLIGGRFFLRRTQLPQLVLIPAPGPTPAISQTRRNMAQTERKTSQPNYNTTQPDRKIPQPDLAEAETMPSRIVMRPARPKRQPILATLEPAPAQSRSQRTALPPAHTTIPPGHQPYIQLPSKPTPAKARPCVVTGVLEPS